MANALSANTFYVDSSSSSGTSTSYVSLTNLKITGIIATGSATTDTITVYDKDPSSAAAGTIKMLLSFDTAKKAVYLDLSRAPIVCPNGLWVALSGTPTATFIGSQNK